MSVKSFFLDTENVNYAATKITAASAGAGWALSDLDGAQVAGWATALYVTLQIFILMPKLYQRIHDAYNRIKSWFK